MCVFELTCCHTEQTNVDVRSSRNTQATTTDHQSHGYAIMARYDSGRRRIDDFVDNDKLKTFV